MECTRAEAAWISARKRTCEGQVCLRRLRGPRTWPHQHQDRVGILDGVLLRITAWTQRCTHCGPHCLQTMSCSVHGLGEFYAVAKRNWLMHCRARDSILRMYSTSAICIECARAEAAWVSARKRRCEGQVCLRRLRGPRTWPHQDQDRVAILDGVLLRTTAWTLRCTHCGPHCLQTMSCSVHGLGEFYAVGKRNWLMHCRARDSILRMYSTSAICIECARAEAAWVSARKRRCEGQVCLRRLRGPRTWPHQDQDRVAILDGVLLRTTAWTLRYTHCELHCLKKDLL